MGARDDDPGAGGAGGRQDDGRPDEDLDEDLDDDEDGDGGDGGGGNDDDDDNAAWKPPTREVWERTQRINAARKQERNDARARVRALEAQLRGGKGDGDGEGAGKQQDGDAAAEEKWRTSAARNSAATQLQAAGFSGTAKQAKRLTRLLDLANAEPDADGDFDFEDEIDDLRTEYPQLFGSTSSDDETRRPPARRPTTADRGRRTPRDADQDPTTRTSDRLLRSAGVRPPRR